MVQLGRYLHIIYNLWRQKKKKQSAYSEEQQAMDPKYQRVKLNDGHFIPILGFGTYAPEEVRVVVMGWHKL